MQTIKLQQRGVLTLPKKLRDKLDLFEGQSFRVQNEGKRIILEVEDSFDTQLMTDIKQGLEDIKNGKFIEFSSIGEFHEKLAKYED
jgi:bifunctional DNA-binding transcriptional regulator/antitoxin component of YhaV-PrlF toxin-antitoxin module